MLWRDLRGRTRRNTKQLQNLDLLGSPHLEEELIGGMVDLDLLSYFPKDGQESLEGRVGIKLSRFAIHEQRETGSGSLQWGRRGLFIGPPEIQPLCAEKTARRYYRWGSGTTATGMRAVPHVNRLQRQRYPVGGTADPRWRYYRCPAGTTAGHLVARAKSSQW